MGNLLSRSRSHNQHGAPSSQSPSIPPPIRRTGSPRNMQACLGASTPSTKKALLIGIRYKKARFPASSPQKSMDLKEAPHKETQMWHDMLIQSYGYPPEQITTMQDIGKYKKTNRWPNRENILAQLEELVRNVRPGDRRFLFIAGHGGQLSCTSDLTELDGRDEIMYSLENDKKTCLVIKDNDLRRILVDNLPAGVTLTIVLELCHSGTLIDLPFRLKKNKAGLLTVDRARRDPVDLQGNILCLSACEDSQNAYGFDQQLGGSEQGIITTAIGYSLAGLHGLPRLRVQELYDALVKACQSRDSSEAAQTSAMGAAQTPVVTLGRRLSDKELETLVFQP